MTQIEFPSDLVLRQKAGKADDRKTTTFYVDAPFVAVGAGIDVTVPKGFATDLASVPRLFRFFAGRAGIILWAAVVHDYLYTLPPRKMVGLNGDYREAGDRRASRLHADRIFSRCMASLGVPRWQRYGCYYAVRLFGGFVYGKSH